MKPDWNSFLNRLQTYASARHRILPPCPVERLETVQRELGKMPTELVDMLTHFNGARLFCINGPLVSIFGISIVPPLPPLEWAPDWYIDKFTPAWRALHKQRLCDWVIGMTSYGGLIVLDSSSNVTEWDTSQNMWSPDEWTFDEWLEGILRQGEADMAEWSNEFRSE